MELSESQLRELISEAKEDEVGLWLIVAKVRDEFGVNDHELVKRTTLNFVQQLLDSGEIVAGFYKSDGSGVIPWNLDSFGVIKRIESEWKRLGRDPDIGEIVVLISKCQNL
jgi:hypothetical protein